jgi:putative ABC transport system substrate-binding protein
VKRLTVALLALAFLATPFPAAAQAPSKVLRVGHLFGGGRTPDGLPPRPLRDALRELGYVEGRNVAYEARFAEGQIDQLPGLAAELVRVQVDVIVAQGGAAAVAAKQATQVIPIVIAPASGDFVALGLIASLAHPGGNVTGMTDEIVQLSAKRVEMLKEALPKIGLIAVIWNANDQGMTLRYRGIEQAAQAFRLNVQALGVREPDDFAVAFATMARRRPDALFLVADAFTSRHGKRVIEYAALHRIPAMYEFGFLVRDGGLMSYGPSPEDGFRRAALYIDRLFKGAKPADLPAEQPTRYYLSVNLKTAKALGLTIPPSVLARADEMIQ